MPYYILPAMKGVNTYLFYSDSYHIKDTYLILYDIGTYNCNHILSNKGLAKMTSYILKQQTSKLPPVTLTGINRQNHIHAINTK